MRHPQCETNWAKYGEVSFILSAHRKTPKSDFAEVRQRSSAVRFKFPFGWQVKTTLVEVALVSTSLYLPQSLAPQELPSQKGTLSSKHHLLLCETSGGVSIDTEIRGTMSKKHPEWFPLLSSSWNQTNIALVFVHTWAGQWEFDKTQKLQTWISSTISFWTSWNLIDIFFVSPGNCTNSTRKHKLDNVFVDI